MLTIAKNPLCILLILMLLWQEVIVDFLQRLKDDYSDLFIDIHVIFIESRNCYKFNEVNNKYADNMEHLASGFVTFIQERLKMMKSYQCLLVALPTSISMKGYYEIKANCVTTGIIDWSDKNADFGYITKQIDPIVKEAYDSLNHTWHNNIKFSFYEVETRELLKIIYAKDTVKSYSKSALDTNKSICYQYLLSTFKTGCFSMIPYIATFIASKEEPGKQFLAALYNRPIITIRFNLMTNFTQYEYIINQLLTGYDGFYSKL